MTKPEFLTRPQAYTQARRTSASAVDEACAIERFDRPTGYGPLWWTAMVVIAVLAAAVLVVDLEVMFK